VKALVRLGVCEETLTEIAVNGFDSICRKGKFRAAPSEMTYISLGLVSPYMELKWGKYNKLTTSKRK